MSTYKSHIATEFSIIVVFDDKVLNFAKGSKFYSKVKEYIAKGKFHLLDVEEYAKETDFRSECGGLKVRKGIATIEGEPLPEVLSRRLVDLYQAGAPCYPLVRFWKNLKKNPSKDSQKELFDFLMHSNIPLTEDGCFVAYKRVTKDFKDICTRTYNNSPGEYVTKPRSEVNADRNQTCSDGLHAAAWGYLDSYANENESKTVEVKINPRDVVSIPVDYQNMKMRVCAYLVIREVTSPNPSVLLTV